MLRLLIVVVVSAGKGQKASCRRSRWSSSRLFRSQVILCIATNYGTRNGAVRRALPLISRKDTHAYYFSMNSGKTKASGYVQEACRLSIKCRL